MKKVRILFLCFGNACRSAMAEKIANHLFPDKVIADSAGTFQHMWTVDMDAETIGVMKEVDIDISRHRPKYFASVGGEWDVVVNMSPERRNWIVDQKPNLLSARWVDWRITDPRGRPINIYRGVRDVLIKNITELVCNM
jgi:protein-tyrosine-phosphatase